MRVLMRMLVRRMLVLVLMLLNLCLSLRLRLGLRLRLCLGWGRGLGLGLLLLGLRLLRMRMGLRIGHDATKTWVLDVHAWICDVHHGLCCKILAKLSSQLQLLHTGRVRRGLLWRGRRLLLVLGFIVPCSRVIIRTAVLSFGRW